ncbi:MAG: shikimate kinase [Candidatus Caldatribacteriota bacterium]|nr:shikimate kinase [Candidatus Caldatribacteriota bacterium]
MKNIVLVGLEGTRKYEIGKELSEKLKMDFISTDESMKEESGLELPQLLKKVGENKFRLLESSIIEKISSTINTVIIVGGGSILDRNNIKKLKRHGLLVNLISSQVEIKKKKTQHSHQFLAEQWEQVFQGTKKILNLKAPSCPDADYVLDITDLTVEQITGKIIKIMEGTNNDG